MTARRIGRRPAPPEEAIAAIVARLAVLMAAGLAPAAAFAYVTRSPGETPAPLAAAARAAAEGGDVPAAVRSAAMGRDDAEAWSILAAAWQVATTVGAPLAGTLRDLAAALRQVGRQRREVEVALAGPRATSRLVTLMPVVAVGFGALLGLGTLATILATPPGWMCVGVGSALLLAGHRWSSALVKRAQPVGSFPGASFDLTAIALAGGVSVDRAHGVVAEALAGFSDAAAVAADADSIGAVITFAEAAGVPAADLLRAEADDLRLRAADAAQERVARLAIALLLPLGVCALPAFLLLGVAPMLISVISSTTVGL